MVRVKYTTLCSMTCTISTFLALTTHIRYPDYHTDVSKDCAYIILPVVMCL